VFEESTKIRRYLKVALFGDGGSGKTRFLLSFPKVAVIDTEHGTDPYRGKYDFKVKHAGSWKELGTVIEWLEANPEGIETFAIDSLTVFYQDLINDLIEHVKNKRGHEILSQAEWTIIKRRWAAFLNRLVKLPMNCLISMRERDEYEETTNRQGEEVRKKTGNQLMDADKQTKYIFDVSLRCFTEENQKKKESKFLVRVDKTRYDWMPKYAVYDITMKRAFDELFVPYMDGLSGSAPEILRTDIQQDNTAPPEAPGESQPTDASAPSSTAQAIGDMLTKFCGPAIDPSQPAASGEDIKVLMTRAGTMTWPDGSEFKSAEGKAMIKALFKIEKSKDLRKPQVDWLYGQFGDVLAGRARIEKDQQGIPFIAAVKENKEAEVAEAK
jgi:hypothetical protein